MEENFKNNNRQTNGSTSWREGDFFKSELGYHNSTSLFAKGGFGKHNPNNGNLDGNLVGVRGPVYGVDPMTSVKRFFKHALNFGSEASRSEFWWPALFQFVLFGTLDILKPERGLTSLLIGILGFLVWVALVVPSISVTIRRLRNAGFSPFLILLNLIPGIGTLCVLVLCAFPTRVKRLT